MANNNYNDDQVQHGIDDNASGDAEKGAALGGLGGVAVGAAAGSLAGPVGTVIGAVVGGVSGALASGAAVAAVDAIDNDNTVSGVGDGATGDINSGAHTSGTNASGYVSSDYETGTYASGQAHSTTGEHGHNIVTGDEAQTDAGNTGLAAGAVAGGLIGTAVGGPVGAVVGGTLGSLAGGVAGDASEAIDEVGDPAHNNSGYAVGADPDLSVGNGVPGIQTGGTTTHGADTRGLSEKAADAITGDRYDDKTGGVVR